MRRGEPIHGFGHPLYPNGDPRPQVLIQMLAEHLPKSKELHFALRVAKAAGELISEKPTIDFALVAMSLALKMEPGVPIALFPLGRTIGWVVHAIEQYPRDHIILPPATHLHPPPPSP